MPDEPAGSPRSVEPHTADEARTDDAPSDPELLAATREGDTAAYAVLYERHVAAARRLARVLSKDAAGADDLVSETFAKLLHTLREGHGPDLAFRPYMLRTLRNTFYDRVRRDRRVEFTGDLDTLDALDGASGSGEHDPTVERTVEGAERRYAALAFGKLPERWRMVLWHTEVEEDTPARIAAMLGMTANGVAALAYRAREKLRQNYLTEHAADSPPEACRWTVDRLGARVRGKLGVRDSAAVDEHLEGCIPCNLLFAELTELNSGLRLVLAPVILGTAAAPYLAAGAASAAGVAVGGLLGAILAPFVAVGNWIRRIVQHLGPKGSIATGTAGAVALAVVVALVLAPDEPEDEPRAAPEPPAVSEPQHPAETEDTSPTGRDPGPSDPEPGPEDDDPPTAPEPEAAEEPGASAPDYGIEHGLGPTGLVAGGEAVLPIRLATERTGGGYAPSAHHAAEAAETVERARPAAWGRGALDRPAQDRHAWGQAAATDVNLVIVLPEGVTLAAEAAEPGWRCEAEGARVLCTTGDIGQTAVAEVRVAIAEHVSGYQTFGVSITGPDVAGTAELRIPIAPAGAEVAYAGLDGTGVTAVGNTWLTCAAPVCYNGYGPKKPYEPGPSHPQPPPGREGEAVSGAVLSVPSGAEILWAGLYWAGSDAEAPEQVALAGPDGAWTDVSAAGSGGQSFAAVTALVEGPGTYWLAADAEELPASQCRSGKPKGEAYCRDARWAGWSLTIVYVEPGAESREIAVYDGARAADTAIHVRGGGEVTLAHTLWGGSAHCTGDGLAIGDEHMGEPGRGRANGAVNNPGWYTYGVDVAVNSADVSEDDRVRFVRGGDPFIVGVVAIASPSG